MKGLTASFARLLASKKFFYVVLGFFVFQALWFVFSTIYPMAFDEDFHFGIISIYAGQWSPFLAEQPPNADMFGALARDPSYLYHYLMSFPLRLIALFTDSQTVQVIVLRLINVGLFAWSLVLFRRILLRVGLSAALANLCLALFTLVPIVPMLAAHINYDNLLMVLVAGLCLYTFRLVDGFDRRRIDVTALSAVVLLCLFASIVKYASLPILLAVVLFVCIMAFRAFRGRCRMLRRGLITGYKNLRRPLQVALTLLFIVGFGLFVQRYGVNVVQYHTLVPECDQVLSQQSCSAYGPWQRNHLLAASKGEFNESPFYYTTKWLWGLWHRMFFAVSGPINEHATRRQLIVPASIAIGISMLCLVALLGWWRRVFAGHRYLWLFLLVIVLYGGILWAEDYSQYLYTGQPVAINGRYLIPILLFMAALGGRALSVMLGKRQLLKVGLAAIALLGFLHGGGVMTFILRSDPSWNWPNQAVIEINDAARRVLSPVIVEGKTDVVY